MKKLFKYVGSEVPIIVLSAVFVLILIMILAGLINFETSKSVYRLHFNHIQGAEAWSYGTAEDAKRVVSQLIANSKIPGELDISYDHLYVIYPHGENKSWAFDNTEIEFGGVHMLLTRKDLAIYTKWLKKISKPYIKGEKMLIPPYMPPPWKN